MIQSHIGIAICKKAIGSILYEQGQKGRAKLLMREAIDIIKETQDAFHDMEIQMALCEVLIADRQLEEAQLILTNILKNARAINSFEHLKISYELQSDISRKNKIFNRHFIPKKWLLYTETVCWFKIMKLEFLNWKIGIKTRKPFNKSNYWNRKRKCLKKIKSIKIGYFY
jgi:tetratricopeptide (TPR) repeat protein